MQEDPELFDRLRRVVRTTLGVEMEGAGDRRAGARASSRRAIVVKAVSDHADLDKDDSFRAFACRASAEVLMAFLQKHLEPRERARPSAEPDERAATSARRRAASRARLEDRGDGFLARVERVALLRDPGATVTRHRAPAPFAGVLEVAVRGRARSSTCGVIGALDQPITEALVART